MIFFFCPVLFVLPRFALLLTILKDDPRVKKHLHRKKKTGFTKSCFPRPISLETRNLERGAVPNELGMASYQRLLSSFVLGFTRTFEVICLNVLSSANMQAHCTQGVSHTSFGSEARGLSLAVILGGKTKG